jgi:hypothetical protein
LQRKRLIVVITFFSLPKAFRGHFEVIQRNAITSWTRLSPRPEIILFGNEHGTAEIARQLGLRHVPEVRRSEYGTPLVNDLFEKAQELATCSTLCYANADILLLSDFMKAVEQVASWRDRFLMVGRRTNLDLDQLLVLESPDWETRLRVLVRKQGTRGMPFQIDYFVFTRGLYPSIPDFAIGRTRWDNWLIWSARASKVPVTDASAVVTVIHQNHDYSHHPKGETWLKFGVEAKRNRKIAGSRTRSLNYATHKLTLEGIKWNAGQLSAPIKRFIRRLWVPLVQAMLPTCHRLGIRKERLARLANRVFGTTITWK